MKRPVSLTLHRNTAWKRELHQISAEMIDQARHVAQQKGVAGYVLIAWNVAGKTTVAANLSQMIIPPRVVPAYVMQELQDRLIGDPDATDETKL